MSQEGDLQEAWVAICKGLSCSNSPKPFSESDLDNLEDINDINDFIVFYSTSAIRKFMVCFTIMSMG